VERSPINERNNHNFDIRNKIKPYSNPSLTIIYVGLILDMSRKSIVLKFQNFGESLSVKKLFHLHAASSILRR
jgi:hypothetical protein